MLPNARRLQSIDVFRALTMFLMIFVNDVDGVSNIPEWIKHVSADTDGLGFADTIFPAFLFIVGLSLPFAIANRLKNGKSNFNITWYILSRGFALLLMGFFHVNLESYSDAAVLPKPVWEIAITVAFFFIWLDYAKTTPKGKKLALQALGVIILIVAAILFKGGNSEKPEGMRLHWYGILGLIGWSYLICAFVYLFSKGKLSWLVAALLFFLLFNTAAHAGKLEFLSGIHKYIWIVGDASMPSFTMAGVVISALYTQYSNKISRFWSIMLLTGLAMIIFGFITRPLHGISKIHATPSWVGICTGISIFVFALVIYLVDIKGKKNWFNIISPAGTSTLTCYLIPYILYSLYQLLHFSFPAFLDSGAGGIIKSLLTALVVILIVGVLEKKRIRLKI